MILLLKLFTTFENYLAHAPEFIDGAANTLDLLPEQIQVGGWLFLDAQARLLGADAMDTFRCLEIYSS